MKNLILFIFIVLFLSTKIDLLAQQNTDSTKKTKRFWVARFGIGNSPSYFASTIRTLGVGMGLPNEKYILGFEFDIHQYSAHNIPSDYRSGSIFPPLLDGFFESLYDRFYILGLSIQRSIKVSKSIQYKLSVGANFCSLTTRTFIKNQPTSGWVFFQPSHSFVFHNQSGMGINIRNGIALKILKHHEVEFSTLVHLNTINQHFYSWQLFFNLRNH